MHRQAIITKFHGPTMSRGARISARAAAAKINVPWDYALNVNDNHTAAAKSLAEKLDWAGVWASGGHPDGEGDVFVLVADETTALGQLSPAFVVEGRANG